MTEQTAQKFTLVVHGGSGAIARTTSEKSQPYRDDLTAALKAGHSVLLRGASAMDAVGIAIRLLEESPLFNAGKGAVFTHSKTHGTPPHHVSFATLARRVGRVVHGRTVQARWSCLRV